MNKKSISPVIATIILIVIVVALATSSYLFISNQIQTFISISEENTERVFDISLLEITYSYLYNYRDGLVLYLKFDEGEGNITYDSSGYGNNGIISGNIIGDFENTLDGFNLDCGGLPAYDFVPGKIGKGLKIWSTGGDRLACVYKSLGSAKPKGYTIWFYGKGYVRAGIWNGSNMVSYVEDVESGCRTPNGMVDVYSYCNNGKPYQNWRLFKLVVHTDSISTATIYLYDRPGNIGEQFAGYYDFITDGPVWVDGIFGKALRFDGVDDYVEIADSSSLDTPSITIALLFKLNQDPDCDNNNNWRSFLRKGGTHGTLTGWDIVLEEHGDVAFDVSGTRWFPLRRTTELLGWPIGEWHFYAFTYDADTGEMKFYKDGTLIDIHTRSPGPIVPNDYPILISGGINADCPNGGGFVPGEYDEILIFNKAIGEKEIKNLYYRIHLVLYNPSNKPIDINNTLFSINDCIFKLILNDTFITNTGDSIIRQGGLLITKVAPKCNLNIGENDICIIGKQGEICDILRVN